MKKSNFEYQKTNLNTIQNTKNNSQAIFPKTNINTIQNISHITQQKTNNIPKIRDIVLFPLQYSDKLIRHNPAATSEWDNSHYSYANGESQLSAVIDESTYELVKLFFNSRPKNIESSKSSIFNHKSILKTFIARPHVKSNINRARITIYKYNRQKVYYMNMLKKSFTLWPNKNLKKPSVNLRLNSPSKKVVTTVNPSLNSLPVKGIKKSVFPPLAKAKKGIRSYNTYAVPFAFRDLKKRNVRYLSQKVIKPSEIKLNIRKVLSISRHSNITLPAIKNNNLSIIQSEKKSMSRAPTLVITRSGSQKWLENPYNNGVNKSDTNIQKIRKSVESIKKKLKQSKSNILYQFSSKNNQIILTEVRKGHKKYTDSKNITKFGKLPFNKKVPGKFKRGNKGINLFVPTLYSTNQIRYWYLPAVSKSRITLSKKRKTTPNIVNISRVTPKRSKRNIIQSRKPISTFLSRKLKIGILNGEKSLLLNILRNKTFHLVLSTLKDSFKSKSSILVLKRIENYSLNFYLKVKSLKLFLFNFGNMGNYDCAPGFLLTIWNKLINTSNPVLPTFPLAKKGAKQNANFNKITIPSLQVGKFVGKIYKRIFASKFYYTILWVYYMKSNNIYLSRLNNILKKRYGKKISLNIVDLKYLYLDSNIMAEAITTKLKDRKKRVLRVLKRALGLIKKPYFKIHFYNRKKTLEQLNVNFLLMDKNLNMSTYSLSKNILNKDLFKKPSNYKSRLLLFHLKHKIVSGVRLQGSGRLTRRLTASRSISKFKYMGSLQNIESSRQAVSTVMLRGYMKSNLQYMNINSYNRNGAFGVKVSVSSY
jgi:Mitochondrial ribosomal protein (VAR1)